MKCTNLRRLLSDGGPAVLAGNQEAEDHLVDCSRCYAVLEAMTEIDLLLPELESHDVAEEVVEQLLARSELREKAETGSSTRIGRLASLRARLKALSPSLAIEESFKWLGSTFDRARQARLRWGIVAVPAVILIGIVSVLTMRSVDAPLASKAPYVVKQVKSLQPAVDVEEQANRELSDEKGWLSNQPAESVHALGAGEAGRRDEGRQRMSGEVNSASPPQSTADSAPKPKTKTEVVPDPVSGESELHSEGGVAVTGSLIPRADLTAQAPVADGAQSPARQELTIDPEDFDDRVSRNVVTKSEVAEDESEVGTFAGNARTPSDGPAVGDEIGLMGGEELSRGNKQNLTKDLDHGRDLNEVRRKVAEIEAESVDFRKRGDFDSADQLAEQYQEIKKQLDLVDVDGAGGKATADKIDSSLSFAQARAQALAADDDALSAARRFLEVRSQVEGLSFREARGYWANTYVPGDRTLRRLKARLDRMAGAGAVGNLHAGSRQISQPFDPPEAAALAVYLHGDRTGVETRERLLVQVGLKGTSRRSGIRPAMNVGLVLDLRGEVEPTAAASIRALLQAFAASTELGDRFSLTVAGRPGGTILPPGDLRHGPLTVAMVELFGDEPSGAVMSLDQAVAAAQSVVRADDDPNAPLGSSALIVITAQRLGGSTGRLAAMAHQSAVDGVPWSVIGIGQGIDLAELDALVLAGQGNRRLLISAADAESLVDRELAAVSRVVARAVRLRIRLAPGVQLVDVIGSERLDERRSQQVRVAEQSVDQRLSRNLGIQADRGLDEDGIQIIIPSFYADNAHVVLLDVVVPGPGPVADVTVRYKDVVHMRNGVARAHLRVGRSASAAGPLERNVLANLVATEVASRLDAAADAVATGNVAVAQTILDDTLGLVRGITSLVEGLGQNPDLEADMEMLSGYLQALSTLPVNDLVQLRMAADSLRYAGRLKILPPPVNDDQID